MQREKTGKVWLEIMEKESQEQLSVSEEKMLRNLLERYQGSLKQEMDPREEWPAWYHSSHVRMHGVEWLPIQKEDRVLEIGAGYGDHTCFFAAHAKETVCLETSLEKSRINAVRNQACSSLTIRCGRLEELLANLEQTFEWICLPEAETVLAQNDLDLKELLQQLSGLLSADGKIAVAVENRMGLQYFAGMPEEVSGRYFEGIEGFPGRKTAAAFSKPQLEKTAQEAGFLRQEFYYPYPDHRLPERVYSDAFLPMQGELNRNRNNYGTERLALFSEEKAYDGIVQEGLYPLFANSFLVILKKEKTAFAGPRLIYTKYSTERRADFRIRTDITEEEDGSRSVWKRPFEEAARRHIYGIEKSFRHLTEDFRETKTPLRLNQCVLVDDAAKLEYLQGITLEQELDELLEQEGSEAVREKIKEYFLSFSYAPYLFETSAEFEQVFGLEPMLKGQSCRKLSDIDMVFANVMHTKDGYELIDYEWTFECLIPVRFLWYRCLYYYLYGNSRREELLRESRLFDYFDFSAEEIHCYERMEKNFQQYILGEYVPLWHRYEAVSKGVIPVGLLAEEERRRRKMQTLQIVVKKEDGALRQENRILQKGENRLRISVPEHAQELVCTLEKESCVIRFLLKEQDGTEIKLQTNGQTAADGDYLFDAQAPAFTAKLSGKQQELQLRICAERMEGISRELILNQDGKIRWMEQTKLWRLYQAIKRCGFRRGR